MVKGAAYLLLALLILGAIAYHWFSERARNRVTLDRRLVAIATPGTAPVRNPLIAITVPERIAPLLAQAQIELTVPALQAMIGAGLVLVLVLLVLVGPAVALAALVGLPMMALSWLQGRARKRVEGLTDAMPLYLDGVRQLQSVGNSLSQALAARGRDRSEIEGKLRSAGYFESGAIDGFVWLRLSAALAVGAVTLVTAWTLTGNPLKAIFPTFALSGLTYIGAKYVLHMRASSRERILSNEFPFLLDLMLMMLESGVSLDQCFRGIARDERVAVPNHSRLVAMLVDDLDRGQDYQVAFDRWAQRVGVNGSRELAALFRQSLFQGMELVPALREFIREFSQRRVARAREAIGKITVRMVVLMLVFFMPALFIVLAGPPVAAILDTLRSTGR